MEVAIQSSPDAEAFRAGLRNGTLLVQQCVECQRIQPYSARICTSCQSPDLKWTESSGRGNLRCAVEIMISYVAEIPAPYLLASVELEEGPHIIARYKGASRRDDDKGEVRAEFVDGELYFKPD